MDGWNGGGSCVNSFALVSYIPNPLAEFLDQLRRDLAPECHAKAHVTVLPPRPILSPPQDAWQELKRSLRNFPPFRLELADVRIFPVTRVIYLSVGLGRKELESMHAALNKGQFELAEAFEYQPHVTLAQELHPGEVAAAAELAAHRWSGFAHARDYTIDKLTFVRNTIENRWTDLAGCSLSALSDHSNVSI